VNNIAKSSSKRKCSIALDRGRNESFSVKRDFTCDDRIQIWLQKRISEMKMPRTWHYRVIYILFDLKRIDESVLCKFCFGFSQNLNSFVNLLECRGDSLCTDFRCAIFDFHVKLAAVHNESLSENQYHGRCFPRKYKKKQFFSTESDGECP
jgi:hypothetical protein